MGCKNGGFYVLRAADGRVVTHTPIYAGPPTYPLNPPPDKRTLALPSAIGGLQTGCATDGQTIFTNGIDCIRLASQKKQVDSLVPPTAGRVVALSLDTRTEALAARAAGGGLPGRSAAQARVQACGRLGRIGHSCGQPGRVLHDSCQREARRPGRGHRGRPQGDPPWSRLGRAIGVARRVYVGTGNTLFIPLDFEAYFPKHYTGTLYSFGLPGDDEVSRLGIGKE